MSDPAPAPLIPEARDYLQRWAASMTQVLGQIANAAFAIEFTETGPPDAVPPHTSDLLALIVSGGSLRGEMTFRFPQAVALAMAQLLLGETQNPAAEFTQEYKQSVEELLRQVSGHAATALKEPWGEVQLRIETANPPAWSPGATGWMSSAAEAPFRIWLEWQLSAALLAALKMAEAKVPVMANAKAQLQAEASPEANPQPGAEAKNAAPGKAGIFMDVELAVTLRFGGRRLTLREILELNNGSVVELDRQIAEPADLLLEDRVIARGEVVVVDGNYGLRVQEVYPLRREGPAGS
jgi:flagellar motor switch protein FliN/FliY